MQRKTKYLIALAALVVAVVVPAAANAIIQTFNDVPPEDWAFEDVEWLAEKGLTTGCSTEPPLYCPDGNVTRREFAAFSHRLVDLQGTRYASDWDGELTLTGADELARQTLEIPNNGGALHVTATANFSETDTGTLGFMWLEVNPSGDCDGVPLEPASIFFIEDDFPPTTETITLGGWISTLDSPITIGLCVGVLAPTDADAWALEMTWFPTDHSFDVLPSPFTATSGKSAAEMMAELEAKYSAALSK